MGSNTHGFEAKALPSNACGSEVKALPIAESGELLGRETGALICNREEWRDWANLVPDLVNKVADRLLSVDVAEYLRFRAVCRPWRKLTDDPRAGVALNSRFRPRNWIMLSITPDALPRRNLLNLSTAASIVVDLSVLCSHRHLCCADGLQVLLHEATSAISLLDPLTKVVTEFPAISRVVAAEAPSRPEDLSPLFQDPFDAVQGAGFDDSTSPPTLVLLVKRESWFNIVFAKPHDEHWTLVNSFGRRLFYSLLSVGGRCYVLSPEGSVYLVELESPAWLVEIVDQNSIIGAGLTTKNGISFLVSGISERMLMVRYQRDTVSVAVDVELLEVDIVAKSLVPVNSFGNHAAFVGSTHCVLISTEMFPSIVADAVYDMCFSNPCDQNFTIHHLNNGRKRNQPLHKICLAGPCNIDQYLLCFLSRHL